jgi:hypothetical protein
MKQLGRISGQVLEDDLLRQNVNLDFRNLSASIPVLKLDVVNNKIGVNTTAPSQDLSITGTASATNLRSQTTVAVGNLQFSPTGFTALSGAITLAGSTGVVATGIGTDQLLLRDNKIYSYESNANVELNPNASGTIEFLTNTNVTGNIHATGTITSDGSITIGNDSDDDLSFAGELVSDIVPDVTATYDLGSTSRRWSNVWADDVTATDITGTTAIVNGVNITNRQGNIYYVAKNGNNTFTGDHQLDPVLTLTKALTLVSSGDTIHISPGTYVETFPLTVPVNVTITGQDMRNVIITPTGATESNDAFLVNGEVTIENLTVKDFYYNSGSDTGYGFRYTANSVVSSRSPYIRNCTVITKGSVVSASDLRGFDQGDAGRGALVDGASVTTASKEASMLFHAATFITPGQQGLTAKNGVRIEWLNSFAYFASIGIKTEQGSTGQAGQGVKFGAEIRCIGSANVYGTNGIVADGSASLLYLINHNFGYIGAGKDISNDKTLHIQANEVTELNSANVLFTSMDQDGTYRVGSALIVNQETGETVIDSTNFDFSGVEKLTVSTGGQSVQLKGEKVESDFIRFSGSTMESIVGTLNIDANAGDIALTSNTSMQGNLNVTGNVTLGGTLVRLGNADTDTIDFNADIEGNLIPNLNSYTIGTSAKRWNKVTGHNAVLNTIDLTGNSISTTLSNAGLELEAAGSGTVSIVGPARFYNTFTQTTGATNTFSSAAGVTGNVSVANNITSNDATLLATSASTLTAQGFVAIDNVSFTGNVLQGTSASSNLQIVPAGTGTVRVLANLVLGRDLIAPIASLSLASVSGLDAVVAEEFLSQNITLTGDAVIENVAIADNMISTTTSNSDLELRASGTGSVRFKNNVELSGDVITPTTSSVVNTSTNNLGATTLIVQTLNSTNKQIIFEDIMLSGNKISTTSSNSDLTLSGTGTGNVKIKENFIVSNNLTTTKETSLQSTTVTNTLTANNITATGITGVGSSIFEGISLSGNVISTKDSNANLELRANGTGVVNFNDNVTIENGLTVNGVTTIGVVSVANDFDTVNLTVSSLNTSSAGIPVQIDNVRISGNTIKTTATDVNLELRASGTGTVRMHEDVEITNGITVAGKLYAANINIQNDVDLGSLEVLGNIQINDNFIETTVSNSNLELNANGTGTVDYNGLTFGTNVFTNTSGNLQLDPADVLTINTTGSMIVPKGTTAQENASQTIGSIRYNTSVNQVVGYGPTTSRVLSSALLSDDLSTGIELSTLGISNDLNFKVNGSIVSKFTSNNKTEFNKVELGGITLSDNNITVTGTDTNLTLDARHARVTFGDFHAQDNKFIADNGGAVTFDNASGSGYVKFTDNRAMVFPSGTSAQREPSPEQGHTRYNTELSYLEVFTGVSWTTAVGSGGAASLSDMEDLLNTYTIIFG